MVKELDHEKKSVRLAVIALLLQEQKNLTAKQISTLMGVDIRTAQRDIKLVPEVVRMFNNVKRHLQIEDIEKSYSVRDVSSMLGLHPQHVRLLVRQYKLGRKEGGSLRLSEQDLEALKSRPDARK